MGGSVKVVSWEQTSAWNRPFVVWKLCQVRLLRRLPPRAFVTTRSDCCNASCVRIYQPLLCPRLQVVQNAADRTEAM